MRKFTLLLTAALFCGSMTSFAQDDEIRVSPSFENGKPTFTFHDDQTYYGIQMGKETIKQYLTDKDYTHIGEDEDAGRHLWIWAPDGTTNYTFKVNEVTDNNSLGVPSEYISVTTKNVGWSGLGYTNDAKAPIDLTKITEDYTLHMAVKMKTSEDVTLTVADGKSGSTSSKKATIVLGEEPSKPARNTIYTNFTRNGQWYNIDIPMMVLEDGCGLSCEKLSAFVGNIFCVSAGSKANVTFDYDAVFFYSPKGSSTGIKQIGGTDNKNTPIYIYTIDGKKVNEDYAKTNKGVYIVKQGNHTKKVVIK